MVEAGVFLYQVMRAVGQESADVLQVDRRNLQVEAAVEGKYGAGGPGNVPGG